jgi:hypothetical protein
MKIPVSIHMSGHTVLVLLVPGSEFGADNTAGDFSTKYLQIRINRDLPESVQDATLLHEIVEYLAAESEIGLDHAQVSQLSFLLYQVLADNGLNFSWRGADPCGIGAGVPDYECGYGPPVGNKFPWRPFGNH